MANRAGPILVTGATGKQGGAVARALLQDGWKVRALTRNLDKPAARALGAAGAEVVKGDMENEASLRSAVEGCYGVFSVQNYWEKGVGFEGEVRQGKRLVDAAKACGVRHFVQASVAGRQAPDAPEHFRCKWEIEKLIRAAGLPATMLREVFFMDNFAVPKQGTMVFPLLSGALRPDLAFHMIAVDDIGGFAARVFGEPERFIGQEIDLAGDAVTVSEMKQIYARVTGRKPPGWKAPKWLTRWVNLELARQLHWNNTVGWTCSVQGFRELWPGALSFERFVEKYLR